MRDVARLELEIVVCFIIITFREKLHLTLYHYFILSVLVRQKGGVSALGVGGGRAANRKQRSFFSQPKLGFATTCVISIFELEPP